MRTDIRSRRSRLLLAVSTTITLLLSTGCAQHDRSARDTVATQDDVSQTVATSLGDMRHLDEMNKAMSSAGLRSVFDGPGSYTLLAPDDAAFAALGDRGRELFAEEERPMLVAVLRDHILPGHLTPEDIAKAIHDKGGPVTMATLGGGTVTFSKASDGLIVTGKGGFKATLMLPARATTNGVIIPIGTVLMPPSDPSAS